MRRRGFTLMELLVVMAIIAILIAILLPAFRTARMMARRARAKAEVNQIAMAWSAYLNDYRTWAPGVTGLTNMNSVAVATLRGDVSTGNNPRGVMYLEVEQKGLDANGNMIDPWNQSYAIALDRNYVNQVTTPDGAVYRNVAVWTSDPDKPVGDSLRVIGSWKQ